MESKLTVIVLVIACSAVAYSQFQTLPYNPSHRPNVQTLPYNPNNRPQYQRLPYYPSQSPGPKIFRARRDLLSGQISSNPNGGADAKIQAGAGIGDPTHNLVGGVFAAGNTMKGPVTSGGALEYNINGHGLSLTKTHTPGVADVLTQNAKVNLFSGTENKLDANLFKSQTTLANGFDFTKTGGNIDFNNINGHGAKLGMSSIPGFGTTYDLGAKANLWRSDDKMTTVDLFGSASKVSGGPFDGQKNFGGGIGLTSIFG